MATLTSDKYGGRERDIDLGEEKSLSASSSTTPSSELDHELLPAPAISLPPNPGKSKTRYSTAAIIPVWIVLSSAVIIYNNYVYNTLNFKFPVFLVTWHLTFAVSFAPLFFYLSWRYCVCPIEAAYTMSLSIHADILFPQAVGTRVLQRTTHLLDSVKDVHISRDMFMRSILPIGILFSGSLILSNKAYLYLSVHYIQMLKAFNPVAILLITWVFRLAEPNKKLGFIVVMISSGVALASHGELHFDLTGFIIQAVAVAFEASRLVMIQVLLHGLKMDPLVSLHYYAPVCVRVKQLNCIVLLIVPFPFRDFPDSFIKFLA